MKLETKQVIYFFITLIMLLGGLSIILMTNGSIIEATTFNQVIIKVIGIAMFSIGVLVYKKHFKSIV